MRGQQPRHAQTAASLTAVTRDVQWRAGRRPRPG
jgi:hypothetical protein